MEHAVIPFLVLLLIASLVGMGARRLALPYTLALVLAGIGLSFAELAELQGIHLTPDLLLAIFLPALLFEAAYNIEFGRFVRDLEPILTLAVPGVLLSVVVTGTATWEFLRLVGMHEFTWGEGLLLASMVSATDPISVLSLFRSMGVTRRLYLLVEGESLLNDGVAVAVFIIIAAVVGVNTGYAVPTHLHGAGRVIVYGIKTFGWMAGGGVVIGALAGVVASVLTRQVDDRLVEVALSLVLAYGSFILAEQAETSGVLAVVSAGTVLGSFGSRYGMSAATRVAIKEFWEFLAFFSNSFVFLLVGIELDIFDLADHAGIVLMIFMAVLLGRAVSVYGGLALYESGGRLIRRWRGGQPLRAAPIPRPWWHVMWWGGLRGALSMVLVIGLPQDYPHRSLMLVLVFGVVSLSLFVQGLTMKPLLVRLGLSAGRHAEQLAFERARARALAADRALAEIDRLSRHGALPPEAQRRLVSWYRRRKEEGEAEAERLGGELRADDRLHEAASRLLTAEEDALRAAAADGLLSEAAVEAVLAEMVARRELLRQGTENPENLSRALEALFGEK